MSLTVVCPGSFDPVTNGHLDVFARASRLFENVIVAVMVNRNKQGLFSSQERIDMVKETVAHLPNVKVEGFEGLLADFCKQRDIGAIVKGLRAVSDFDYEIGMAQLNRGLTSVETLFIATNPEFGYLSSSVVKDVASFQGDVSGLVPPAVAVRLKEKFD
ncbi:MAG: pantetheine-phosphate adenylyltransferase [Actinobacteria bacterium]|nr:pantetheine-phosphate adenylyltransferase [Actinomycetota bacterium]